MNGLQWLFGPLKTVKNFIFRAPVLFILLVEFYPFGVSAEIYQWLDDEGNLHYTDNLNQVPLEQRKWAKEKDEYKSPEKVPSAQEEDSALIPPKKINKTKSQGPQRDDLGHTESYWKNKMYSARSRMNQVQQRVDQINANKRRGAVTSYELGRLPVLKKQLEQLKYEVEIELPDEARKAGAPPGWLR